MQNDKDKELKSKYCVIKQRDGSITYARWWKAGFIGPNGRGGGLSYNSSGANVPAQWRALNPIKHHKKVELLKQALKDGEIQIIPIEQLFEPKFRDLNNNLTGSPTSLVNEIIRKEQHYKQATAFISWFAAVLFIIVFML